MFKYRYKISLRGMTSKKASHNYDWEKTGNVDFEE